MDGLATARQLQENAFEVTAGLEAGRIDARIGKCAVYLGSTRRRSCDREHAGLLATVDAVKGPLRSESAQDCRCLRHLVGRDSDLDPSRVLEQLLQVAFAQQPAAVDDPDDIGELLDLVQKMARDDDR